MKRLALALAASACLAGPAAAQRPTELKLVGPGGAAAPPVPVGFHRGYAAVPLAELERIGWTVARADTAGEARRGPAVVSLHERSPIFRWGGDLLQLVSEPYRFGDALWVPLQLFSDLLPGRSPEAYVFHADGPTLEVREASAWTPAAPAHRAALAAVVPPPRVAVAKAPRPRPAATPTVTPPAGASSQRPGPAVPARVHPRVVVIDPGHGGTDPGARGPRGVREKDIALRIGLALAGELEKRDLEVHLTRGQDRLVPLWERGEWATGLKGGRPAVFISLHANAETSLSARGFETYFLSEARTEHERRVAALENAPFQVGGDNTMTDDPVLEDILEDLSNLDTQHWSAQLADLVQQELAVVHPGPNRGVKQGPLAVITNTLMPAVLVEVGFISNAEEERLLGSSAFQEKAAGAIARAVDRFFASYPPGSEGGMR